MGFDILDIQAAGDTADINYWKKSSQSGLFGSSGGFTLGSQKQSAEGSSQSASAAASLIQSRQGEVSLQAGRDIAITGSDVDAARDASLVAGRDIVISPAFDTRQDSQHQQSKTSGLSATLKSGLMYENAQAQAEGQASATHAAISAIGGENVRIQAARDLTVEGSLVLADQDASLIAGRNLSLSAARQEQQQQQKHDSSSTGFNVGALLGFTGIAPQQTLYGKTSTRQNAQDSASTPVTSLISANRGNLSLVAGADEQYRGTGQGNLDIEGADLLAGQKANLIGNQPSLKAAGIDSQSASEIRQKSFTIGAQLSGSVGTRGTSSGSTSSITSE